MFLLRLQLLSAFHIRALEPVCSGRLLVRN
eukprot:SAG31_NODE_43078_length_268_cov_1.497041_1_plen_29_part_10